MPVSKDPGDVIKNRLRELGLSQAKFSQMVGKSPGWAAARFLPSVDNMIRYFAYREPETLDRILRTLKWTPEEFAEATGLELPGMARRKEGEEETFRGHPVIPGGLVMVPVVGAANGGKPMEYAIPVQKELTRPNTMAFQVEGDSMDDGGEDAIKDGDWVLVDTSLTDPIPGKVFLVELVGDGYTVKRLRKLGDRYWLMSDNPEGESIPIENVARIVGQVYGKVSFQEVR